MLGDHGESRGSRSVLSGRLIEVGRFRLAKFLEALEVVKTQLVR